MQIDAFTQRIELLNPEQRKAVETIEGAVMVIAGPGTGKTQILTLRIANILLKTQVNPENILALTFTESGVHEMRSRLVSIIGTPGYRVEINTFHGFCNDVIKSNTQSFEHLIAAASITDLEQVQILEELIEKLPLKKVKPIRDPFHNLKPLLQAIKELKKEGVSVTDYENIIRKCEQDFGRIEDMVHEKGAHRGKIKSKYKKLSDDIEKNKELLLLYRKYQEILQKRKLYDFEDMLLEVLKKLQSDEDLLLRLQEQYQYFLIDEHQDTNTAQNNIIELLCNYYENPNLFIVGDAKQAIYRFQGASLENFFRFQNLFPSAVLISLQENYRSNQTILDASHELMTKSNDPLPVIFLEAKSKHPNEKIKIIETADYYEEYLVIVEKIKEKLSDGATPSEIAILGHDNRDTAPLIDILEQEGIAYVNESDQNILTDPAIQKLLHLLRCIVHFGEDEYLIKAMHIKALSIFPVDIYKLLIEAKNQRVALWDYIAEVEQVRMLQLNNPNAIIDFQQKLVDWKIAEYNITLDKLFIRVLNESGIFATLLDEGNTVESIDKVVLLFEDIKSKVNKNPTYSLSAYLEYIDLLVNHQIYLKKSSKTIHKNAVRIMTVHRSKGLEFDYVFVVNAFDKHWGNGQKHASFPLLWEYIHGITLSNEEAKEEKNEDDRRLFFVALTRARKEVFLSYSLANLEGKSQIASQFIEEIKSDFKSNVDIPQYKEEHAIKKEQILKPFNFSLSNQEQFLNNLDFFAALFKQKGLSVSHLNNFLSCPWKYFFRNLLSIPEAKSKSLSFGTAVHGAINAYIVALQSNPLDQSYLIDAYIHALGQEGLHKNDYEELKDFGIEILSGFYQSSVSQWPSTLQSEVVIRGIKLTDAVILNGKLDMIMPTSQKNEFLVYDFKTGHPKSRGEIEGTTGKGSGEYKRQLTFYKLLYDRYFEGKSKMVAGILDFIEPMPSGKYKQEIFYITDEEVKELQNVVLDCAYQIINLTFWDQTCGDPACEYCLLRSYMG